MRADSLDCRRGHGALCGPGTLSSSSSGQKPQTSILCLYDHLHPQYFTNFYYSIPMGTIVYFLYLFIYSFQFWESTQRHS